MAASVFQDEPFEGAKRPIEFPAQMSLVSHETFGCLLGNQRGGSAAERRNLFWDRQHLRGVIRERRDASRVGAFFFAMDPARKHVEMDVNVFN